MKKIYYFKSGSGKSNEKIHIDLRYLYTTVNQLQKLKDVLFVSFLLHLFYDTVLPYEYFTGQLYNALGKM